MSREALSYVIVSPVKDEEQYVEATLRTVTAQTVRPLKWVIVDDGSCDRTPEIVEKYARQHDWIQVLRLDNKLSRRPGAAVIQAFEAGFNLSMTRPRISWSSSIATSNCHLHILRA